MKKKLLSLALALVMVLAILPTAAFAADSDFTIENGVLTKYNGKGGAVTIPDSVTSIGNGAFEDCVGLTSITIPNSVTSIGNGAFVGCSGLTSVTIPNSVTSIGERVLVGCTGLTEIQVETGNQNYTSVDGVLFTKDMKTIVAYPGGKKGAYAIPNSVTIIKKHTFQACTGLTSITIPNSVTFIEEFAFAYCRGLTSVTIPSSVTVIGRVAFINCTGLTSVTIPNSVTYIGDLVFSECTGLTSVTIPSSATRIGAGTFGGCEGLKDVYYGGNEAQWNVIRDDFGGHSFRNGLTNATIHYNSTGPSTQPTTPDKPAKDAAHASAQTVTVDGKPVEFQMYALKDANGNDTNYIKLRDMAYVLNGTKAQFNVGYDAQNKTITADTGIAYKKNGTEMTATFGGADKEYVKTTLTIQLDGKPVQLEAITLTDSTGGGYNYCKVRDLGQLLNFNVKWDGGVVIETNKPYGG